MNVITFKKNTHLKPLLFDSMEGNFKHVSDILQLSQALYDDLNTLLN